MSHPPVTSTRKSAVSEGILNEGMFQAARHLGRRPSAEDRSVAPTSLFVGGVLLALGLLLPGESLAQDAERGRQLFESRTCNQCHGDEAQGELGPRLAGTTLSLEEVTDQLRNPMNMMPAFPESRVSAADVADIYAWLTGLSDEPVYPTWFGTDLLNLPTPPAPEPRTLEVHFSHRFNQSIQDAGFERLWGLDSFAFPSFYFAYGLVDRFSVYGGRGANFATWEYGAKLDLLKEDDAEVPISVGAIVGGTYLDADGIVNNSRFTAEVPVGVRVHDRLSVLAVPFFATNPDELDGPDSEGYSAALGLGGSFRMTPGLSIDAEWIKNVGGFERPDAKAQWQAALGIKVGGHLFQIGVSNEVFTTPDFMAAGTRKLAINPESDVRLGFNLIRIFRFVDDDGG